MKRKELVLITERVDAALVTAFAAITPQDLQGWFQHCGYEVVRT